jgi:hypothetical protein
MRGGRDYDSTFGRRQTGEGEYAGLLQQRFNAACSKHGLKSRERFVHNRSLFLPPRNGPQQLTLL